MTTGATTYTDAAIRFTRRATAATAEEHPRAEEGLARAGALRRRTTRGGALDGLPELGPYYATTGAAVRGHLHVHIIIFFGAEQDER